MRRYLVARFGVVGFRREKVSYGCGGGCYPLDRTIGLKPRHEATLWVKVRACELANEYTYRSAAALLSTEIGDEVSHRAVYSWVQKSGWALRQEENHRWNAVFEGK